MPLPWEHCKQPISLSHFPICFVSWQNRKFWLPTYCASCPPESQPAQFQFCWPARERAHRWRPTKTKNKKTHKKAQIARLRVSVPNWFRGINDGTRPFPPSSLITYSYLFKRTIWFLYDRGAWISCSRLIRVMSCLVAFSVLPPHQFGSSPRQFCFRLSVSRHLLAGLRCVRARETIALHYILMRNALKGAHRQRQIESA